MLTSVRKLLENWVARVFFGALIVIFVFWGISNVQSLIGSSSAVAHIGGQPVDLSEVQAEYQRELSQSNPTGTPDLPTRQQIAQNALVIVLRQHALARAEQSLGVAAPDAALRARIYAVPAFQTNGVFDQAKFNQVLQQNNLAPERFLAEEKANLLNGQLLQAITAGAAPPPALVDQVFTFVAEARTAETVTIPLAPPAGPLSPSDAVLRRYWKNHPQQFTAPEYRTIKLVVLSPALLAPSEPVSNAELDAAYAQTAAQDNAPATRSVQIVTADDPAKLDKLAHAWRTGAAWATIQAQAGKSGAAAVELDHATAPQFPSQALSKAVFAAAPDKITGPVQGPLGYFIFKVTGATAAGAPPLAQLAAGLKAQIQLQKAAAAVNQDVDNVQDALAGQTPLDQLPGNLGLTAVEGTLDANGNTQQGAPAPIPGDAKLKAAIIKSVFAGHPGDTPTLITGPDNSYFAFTITTITPPAVQPYDQIKPQVATAWTQDQATRAAEAKAAALLNAVNTGEDFTKAATAAGYQPSPLPPVTRGASPPDGLPADMVGILFSLRPGQATMAQTPGGFIVVALISISQPTAAQNPQAAANIRQALTKSLQNDVAESFLGGLQSRDNVKVDPKLFSQIYQ
jgi:peptidyl-prolyl cis-trans isomerase D